MERDLKCMYCAEAGITNTDVFIEIVDVELGAGWICKECFIESEKEKDEHLKEIEQQLQAKEQECETLASQLDFEVQKKECLEQECEELRKCYKNNSALLDFEETNTTKLVNKVMKLEKTLTEIKEIAEHCINQDICTFCDYSDKCYIEDEAIPTYDVCKLILQKISECEGNDG